MQNAKCKMQNEKSKIKGLSHEKSEAAKYFCAKKYRVIWKPLCKWCMMYIPKKHYNTQEIVQWLREIDKFVYQ